MYVAIQAGEAIAQYDACAIYGAWQLKPFDVTDDDDDNASICFPQVALADNEYGWGLVWGNGFGIPDTAYATDIPLYPTADEGKIDDTAQSTIVFTGVYSTAAGVADTGSPIAVTFPKAVAVS